MSNAFVAGLLQTAAEHRLKAESLRSLVEPGPPWPGEETLSPTYRSWVNWLYEDTMKDVAFHESWADFFEGMAHKIISMAMGELILAEIESLTEPAELQISPFQMDRQLPDLQAQARYMQFYRGFDLGNGFLSGGY